MNDQPQTEESTIKNSESLRILEAVLFASDEVLSTAKLKTIIPDEPDAREIRKMVNEINIQLQKERHPFEIVELAGGYQFRTISYYQPWVQQVFKEKSTKKLSIQALECLAIIAYKQPITKTQIEFIRGVLSDGAMKTLLEKRLVTITGRSEKPGRPLLYGTTQDFLKYFGVNKIADLPNIEEFEAIAKEKMEEFSDEELEQAGVVIEDKPDGEGEHDNPDEAEQAAESEISKENSEGENNQDAMNVNISPDENTKQETFLEEKPIEEESGSSSEEDADDIRPEETETQNVTNDQSDAEGENTQASTDEEKPVQEDNSPENENKEQDS